LDRQTLRERRDELPSFLNVLSGEQERQPRITRFEAKEPLEALRVVTLVGRQDVMGIGATGGSDAGEHQR
jgi:hypothetical protein